MLHSILAKRVYCAQSVNSATKDTTYFLCRPAWGMHHIPLRSLPTILDRKTFFCRPGGAQGVRTPGYACLHSHNKMPIRPTTNHFCALPLQASKTTSSFHKSLNLISAIDCLHPHQWAYPNGSLILVTLNHRMKVCFSDKHPFGRAYIKITQRI